MKNHNDDDIKDALKKGTQKAAGQKDRVWQSVSAELSEQKAPGKSRSRSSAWGRLAVALAAAAVVTVFSFTSPGKAAVAKITDLFAPEKTIDFSLEGNDEQSEFALQTPVPVQAEEPAENAMTFVIYVDEAMYRTEVSEGTMMVTPIDYPADYPPVFMQITQDTERSPEEVAQSLEAELKSKYEVFMNLGSVNDPIDCIKLHMLEKYEWDAESTDYYLVNNTQGGTFIIKAQYFLEAAEGHGARFHYMVEEFKAVAAE